MQVHSLWQKTTKRRQLFLVCSVSQQLRVCIFFHKRLLSIHDLYRTSHTISACTFSDTYHDHQKATTTNHLRPGMSKGLALDNAKRVPKLSPLCLRIIVLTVVSSSSFIVAVVVVVVVVPPAANTTTTTTAAVIQSAREHRIPPKVLLYRKCKYI